MTAPSYSVHIRTPDGTPQLARVVDDIYRLLEADAKATYFW